MFRKNDIAWWVQTGYHTMGGHVTITAVPVRIMSWGKRQGTAVRLDTNTNALCRFYTDNQDSFGGLALGGVVATVEEVESRLPNAVQYAAHRLSRELDCIESNIPNLRPEYRAKAAAEITHLKSLTPAAHTMYMLRV